MEASRIVTPVSMTLEVRFFPCAPVAPMMELVDIRGLSPLDRKVVQVQVLLGVPKFFNCSGDGTADRAVLETVGETRESSNLSPSTIFLLEG